MDGAVAKSATSAPTGRTPRPNELVPSATGVGRRGGSSAVLRGGEAAAPARGSAFETPALLAAVAAFALGLVVLLGWATGIQQLTTILPDAVPMKANAAFLLVLSGAALAVRASGHRPRLVGALAIVVLVIASVTALEYATGIDLGIDRLLASDVARPGAPYAGRMAVSAVIGFAACALGLLSLGHTWRDWHPSAFLALIVAVVGGMGVLGYAYSASELTSIGSVTQIAFPAAIGLVLLAGALIVTDPEHGFMLLLRDPGLTGGLTRRLVPTALLVLPLFGWLELGFVQAGLSDDRLGAAVMVAFEAVILGAVGVWTAGGVLHEERARETERKVAEQALHGSAVLLNETQELVKIGGWAYDVATKTVSWTDEVYRIHELSFGDYNPNSPARDIEFYAPEDQATIDEALRGAVDEGRPYDLELRLITAKGRETWVRTAGRPQLKDGRVVRVYGHIQDITERKMAGEELQRAHERVRRLFDANISGILMVRKSGAILEANDYYLDLIGHTRDELERGELDWRAITPAEWLPASDNAIDRTMAGGSSVPYEKEYLRADGTRVPVLVAVTHLSGPDELIAAFVLDISDLKKAQEALKESERRLSEAQDMAQLGHWLWDVRTGDVEWSEEVFRIFQLDPKTFTPHIDSILDLSPWPEDHERDQELIGRAVENREKGTYEQRFLRPDRSIGYYHSTFQGHYDDEGNLTTIVGTILDTTERKTAELEVLALNAELEGRVQMRTAALEAANRELEAFSYSVSHDLRAPLRSIDAFSRILLDEHSAALDAEGERVLGVVIRNVKQMGVLIDDLLAFSRVARAALERRPVDMQRLAQGVAEELHAAYPDREVAFDLGPLAEVPGDQALLRQVWLNLLGNAVKFTRPVQHAAVEVRSERRGGECRYTVRDNGVGFDPAYADKLFAPFQRLHTVSEFEGTGVGLAIVARIVQRHGGRVWAEGAPGSGAMFGFSLPIKLEAT